MIHRADKDDDGDDDDAEAKRVRHERALAAINRRNSSICARDISRARSIARCVSLDGTGGAGLNALGAPGRSDAPRAYACATPFDDA